MWAADYVLADYGTGAIMAVPAHDQRDLDFARAFGLPVQTVVSPATDVEDPATTGVATPGDGVLVNSGPLDGLRKAEAIARITELLDERGTGKAVGELSAARLADLAAAVLGYADPDRPLPLLRRGRRARRGAAGAPARLGGSRPRRRRARHRWAARRLGQRRLPVVRRSGAARHRHDGHVRRLVVVLPALRLDRTGTTYRSTAHEVDAWLPVAQYTGGVTHAILHLLYARFFTKVLQDLGMVSFSEPFSALLNQGMVGMDGAAMSKSRGNLVRLSDELANNGVDAVRLTMIFAGPPEDDIDWADVSAEGSARFLARVMRLARDVASPRGIDATTGDVGSAAGDSSHGS